MKKFLAMAVLAATALGANTAQAEGFMFSPYIGLEAGRLNVNFNDAIPTAAGPVIDPATIFADSFTLWSPFVGIDLHKYVAIEAGYMGSQSGRRTINATDYSRTEIKGPFADVVLKMPLSGNLNVLGSVGVARLESQVDAHLNSIGTFIRGRNEDTAMRFGLGADLRMHEHFSLRGMFRYTDADFGGAADEYLQYGVSIVYRF